MDAYSCFLQHNLGSREILFEVENPRRAYSRTKTREQVIFFLFYHGNNKKSDRFPLQKRIK